MAEEIGDSYIKERIDGILVLLKEIDKIQEAMLYDLESIPRGDRFAAMEYDNFMESLEYGANRLKDLGNEVKKVEDRMKKTGLYGERIERDVFELVGDVRVK